MSNCRNSLIAKSAVVFKWEMASSRLGSITNCLKRLRQFAPVHKSETSVE